MTDNNGPIVLVRPVVETQHKFSKLVESLSLGYLASALRRDGHDVILLDGQLNGWGVEETVRQILAAHGVLVGFTVTHNHLPQQLVDIFALLARSGFQAPCLVGGHAVSFFPERILEAVPRVDGVISGEGEGTICQIARCLKEGTEWRRTPGVSARIDDTIVRTRPMRLTDLDSLPEPARDLTRDVIRHDGLVAMATSRGCYARCAFCSVPRFYGLDQGKHLAVGDWYARSAGRMASEVESLNAQFGLRELLIVDDEFFGGNEAGFERARAFGQLLAAAGAPVSFAISCRAENVREDVLSELRAGGLAHVFVGIESGTADSLRLYAKRHSVAQNHDAIATIKRLGLSFQAGYMLFNSRSTLADLLENVAFLRDVGECKPAILSSAVDPHFGAPMTTLMQRDRTLTDEGLRLRAQFNDPGVEAARRIAAAALERFEPYMNMLAGLRSSITWEWRRQVPGRSVPATQVIDALEQLANRLFTEVFEKSVRDLTCGHTPGAVIAKASEQLADVAVEIDLASALALDRVERLDGYVRYWSQADLIGTEHFACAT